ncbi:response regulator transcription factor [Algoriphagus kandeliae]|uniref:Response regulator transcription factor n=1 Tax=Algoriphagus kandeliae TaxID=2562278 RepID=A0A4Y9QKR7_9BACT|nr:LytTR family DNA-binding domain-containing protein [Algoriphagus kandeliae]TFV93304.1 response regulator transcription factor [Algoriphagus kandeliae]
MIKTIIIDDEPLAASVVEEFLKDDERFEIAAICHDGFEGYKAIQQHEPDLIFLDVQMPKITGFEMLELLDDPPEVIFTTAFDQYALAAFDAKAIDYLLKPFSKQRFQQAIDRFLEKYSAGEAKQTTSISELADKGQRLVVRVKNEIKIIPTDQVSYFEASDDYIRIVTESGTYLKKMTMKALEDAVSPEKFARIHRSYMLNLNEITRIEPYERDSYLVFLKSGQKLPVSKTGYSRLRQVLGL